VFTSDFWNRDRSPCNCCPDLPANLADNSEVLLPVHAASVLWDGEARDILVIATGRRPLLGTALLDGQELVIQFTEGGLVTIEDL
jgi:predicted aspartyl protease